MPNLEKTRNINILTNIPTKILLRRLQNFCKLSTFFQNQTWQKQNNIDFCSPQFNSTWKLSMRKDYVLLTFIKSKIKWISVSYKDNYINIKYIQHIKFIKQNLPCKFSSDKMQVHMLLLTSSRQVGFALSLAKLK